MPIEVSAHGTISYTGEDGTRYFQAKVVRSALKLWVAGIKVNRHTRIKDLLLLVQQFTGAKFSRNAVGMAIIAMDDWIAKNVPEIKDERNVQG
ncbi:MAG: hypothetical protein HOO86_09950 [Bacteroidales bacterium]|nr:hypothetical protein [Bacteroidales bacterium]